MYVTLIIRHLPGQTQHYGAARVLEANPFKNQDIVLVHASELSRLIENMGTSIFCMLSQEGQPTAWVGTFEALDKFQQEGFFGTHTRGLPLPSQMHAFAL